MKLALRFTWWMLLLAVAISPGCSGGSQPTTPTSNPNTTSGVNVMVPTAENTSPSVPSTSVGPKAVVEKDRIDAGEMEYGLPKDYLFPIRNAGDRPLTLFVRSRDCSCADISGEEQPIAPGKTAEVKVRWSPKPGSVGKEALATVLATNDPTKPAIRLTVEANINPAVRVSPSNWKYIDFERLPPDQPAERVLHVFSSKLSAFTLEARIVPPPNEPPGFAVTVSKMEPGDQLDGVPVKSGYKLVLRSQDKLPRGYIHRDLWVDVEVPGEPKRSFEMVIYAFVPTGLFTVGPEEIAFTKPNLADGDEAKAVVRFDVPTGKETVEITRVEPSFVNVAEPPHPLGNGVWQFTLQVPRNDPEARKYQPDSFFEGRVYLKTTPGEGEVPVRLKWSPPVPK